MAFNPDIAMIATDSRSNFPAIPEIDSLKKKRN